MLVLTLSDIHAPFHNKGTLDFLSDLNNKLKPDKIVCLGDEVDYHAMSEHDHDPDGMSAGHEHKEAMKFMKQLYKLFPVVQCCISNHTSRPFRKAFKNGIPSLFLKEYNDFMEAPLGWSWANRHIIDDVLYLHGTGYSGQLAAITAAKSKRISTVIGHIHSFGGVNYSKSEKDQIFGANAGCLIDEQAYAFKYGSDLPAKPTIGTVFVEDGKVAHFIPLL